MSGRLTLEELRKAEALSLLIEKLQKVAADFPSMKRTALKQIQLSKRRLAAQRRADKLKNTQEVPNVGRDAE